MLFRGYPLGCKRCHCHGNGCGYGYGKGYVSEFEECDGMGWDRMVWGNQVGWSEEGGVRWPNRERV
jgi:hypothetical protein